MALKIGRFRSPQCYLTFPHTRTVANIGILYRQKLQFSTHTVVDDSVGSYHKIPTNNRMSHILPETKVLGIMRQSSFKVPW